jgi:hypothetical protein
MSKSVQEILNKLSPEDNLELAKASVKGLGGMEFYKLKTNFESPMYAKHVRAILRTIRRQCNLEVLTEIKEFLQTRFDYNHPNQVNNEIIEEFAKSRIAPSKIFEILMENHNNQIKSVIAKNPMTPREFLSILAKNEEYYIRRDVAGNYATPIATLKELANYEVQLALCKPGDFSSYDFDPFSEISSINQDAQKTIKLKQIGKFYNFSEATMSSIQRISDRFNFQLTSDGGVYLIDNQKVWPDDGLPICYLVQNSKSIKTVARNPDEIEMFLKIDYEDTVIVDPYAKQIIFEAKGEDLEITQIDPNLGSTVKTLCPSIKDMQQFRTFHISQKLSLIKMEKWYQD